MPTRPTSKRKPLTPRQFRFVEEYLIDYKAEEAALRAGYSPGAAKNCAWMLLKHPEVAQYVEDNRAKMRAKIHAQSELTATKTLQTLADMAYFDPLDMLRPDGTPLPITEMSKAARMALAGFEVIESWEGEGENKRKVVRTRVKLASRAQALDMAAKVAGAYKADNEQRRSAREMTDEELIARILTLTGGAAAPAPEDESTTPPGTRLQ